MRQVQAGPMILRRILTSRGDLRLTEIQFIGVSGQVCGRTYEINSPDIQAFTSRAEAEGAFMRLAAPLETTLS